MSVENLRQQALISFLTELADGKTPSDDTLISMALRCHLIQNASKIKGRKHYELTKSGYELIGRTPPQVLSSLIRFAAKQIR